jgi:pimeloyl-ACP methyl ester carboxylesterase
MLPDPNRAEMLPDPNRAEMLPDPNRAEMLPDPAELSTMNYSGHTNRSAPTRFTQSGEIRFAYRRFGNPVGTPIVLLQHFMGNLDNYDPAITDALASGREVILTDNAGVGLSIGEAPKTVSGMARHAASLIDALGLKQVDLFGFSMGGYVAQQIAVDRPELVRRIVLVGTGPRGGEGMGQLDPDVAPLFGKIYEPQDLMWLPIFFSPSDASQAAGRRFLERIRVRIEDRDAPVSEATVAAHSTAARAWGASAPGSYDYLKAIRQPALVINGSNDIVVATVNSYILQQKLPNAELILFPDSNHGSHFQYTDLFNRYTTDFLDR